MTKRSQLNMAARALHRWPSVNSGSSRRTSPVPFSIRTQCHWLAVCRLASTCSDNCCLVHFYWVSIKINLMAHIRLSWWPTHKERVKTAHRRLHRRTLHKRGYAISLSLVSCTDHTLTKPSTRIQDVVSVGDFSGDLRFAFLNDRRAAHGRVGVCACTCSVVFA